MNQLQNLTDDDFDGAYQAISQAIDYFNLLNFPKPKILKTKENIHMMPFCLYFKKHSSLVRPFNHQINLYNSNGLILKWVRQFKKTRLIKNIQMEPKTLAVDQISGIMTVCGVLNAFSIVVFIFELISTSHASVKKLFGFFHMQYQNKVH